MRHLLVAAAVLMAGCVAQSPTRDDEPATRLDCPAFPDGSPVDCGVNLLRTKDIPSSPPGPETGWLCVLRNRNDQGLGVFDFYVHQDGRMAFAWDLNIKRQGGFQVLHASVYSGAGNHALVAAYQPKGFAVFAEKKPSDTAHVHLLARHFLVDEKVAGNWTPIEASPVISNFEGDAWYTLAFESAQGTEYVSPMVPGEAPRKHEPDDILIENGTRQVFVDVWVTGAKFPNANIAWPSLGNSRCAL